MLSRDTLERAYPFTEQLDAKGITLRPQGGTPLSALVDATRTTASYAVPVDGGFEISLSDIEYMANCPNPATDISDHDANIDATTLISAPAVIRQLNVIRTVVGPAVKQLAEKTIHILESQKTSELLGYEVIVHVPSAPLFNDTLLKQAQKFDQVPYDNPKLDMKMPTMAVSDILKNLETGTGSIDGDVRDWAAIKGDSFFINVWETIFQQTGNPETNQVVNLRDLIDINDFGDRAMAVFLITSRMWDTPPEGTEMTLEQYESTMCSFRDQAANSLVRFMNSARSNAKAGMVVIATEGTCITVFEPAYKEWLAAGGSNEVLFGNLVADRRHYLKEDLLNAQAELLAAWNRFDIMTTMTESAKRYSRTKELLRSVFVEQLYSSTDETEINEDVRLRIVDLFDKELAAATEKDLDVKNIYALAICLQCRSRFIKTDAEQFLNWFDELKQEHPMVDDREIGTICTIRYVAKWLAEMIDVVVTG